MNTASKVGNPLAWICDKSGGWGGGIYTPNDRVWKANTQYVIGDGVEPTTSNGFVYRAKNIQSNSLGLTSAGFGFTSETEPDWPINIGDTVY